MNDFSKEEKDIIDFLQSYPDATPSHQQKARIIARLKLEMGRSQPGKINSLDFLFYLLAVGFTAAFFCFTGVPGRSEDLNIIPVGQAFHGIIFYIVLTGMLTVPLVLTILPINRGGNTNEKIN